MAKELLTPDYIVIFAYFVLMLGIGLYFYRYMKGMKDFFSGDNCIPWWLSSASFFMSSGSVFMFVTYSAIAYRYGIVALTIQWTFIPAVLFIVLFVARKWRRARVNSPVEYLESRYSPIVRQLFTWEGVPARIIDDALKLVATGIFISSVLGLGSKGISQCIFWSGLIILAYIMMGGLWAVVVTDFVQFLVLIIAVIILVPLAISRVGGIGNMFTGHSEGFLSLASSPKYDWLFIFGILFLQIISLCTLQWSLVQRLYCVPTEKDARKMGYSLIVIYLIFPFLALLPALLGPQFIESAPENDKMIYGKVCLELLPSGMMGLIIAAMFAATMSSLSSDLNVCAGVLTNDVYKRYVRVHAKPKELLLVGRILTVVLGLICLALALHLSHLDGEGLINTLFRMFGIFAAPVALPMLFGLFSQKINRKAALSGFLAGISVGLLLQLILKDDFNFMGLHWQKATMLIFATSTATFIVMMIVTWLVSKTKQESQRIREFFNKLETPIGQLEEDKATFKTGGSKSILPFKVSGICVLLVGLLLLTVTAFLERGLGYTLNLVISAFLILIAAAMLFYEHKREKSE